MDQKDPDAPVPVIGGGLAGCEAAWQLASHGVRVRLFEMRPGRLTPAHRTGFLGELVCSNSLKSEGLGQASGLLQEELRRLGSIVLEAAQAHRVAAGQALAVDRGAFGEDLTRRLESHPRVEVVREEVNEIPRRSESIVASGPLTSDALARDLGLLTGSDSLYFYDAIAPIVEGDSIDRTIAENSVTVTVAPDGTVTGDLRVISDRTDCRIRQPHEAACCRVRSPKGNTL
jgi:methylenetetrahydrofolate--tRNA-(uracil-5-)-methyltransferase